MSPKGLQSALADRVGPDLYRINAFRVTGLGVDASDREVGRYVERLRMAQRLGAAMPESASPLPLAASPTADMIAEAAQRLRDPDARLLDRFFWFWPGGDDNEQALTLLRSGRASEAADALRRVAKKHDPVARHNLAVLLHATASDLDALASTRPLSEAEETCRSRSWEEALRTWRALHVDDRFWALWDESARNDSAMAAAFAARFRPGLPEALLGINAQLAVAAARRGDQVRAESHGAFCEMSGFEDADIERAARRAVQPLIHAIESLCAQSAGSVADEPNLGREAADRLLAEAEGPIGALAAILPRDDPQLNAAADQVLSTAQVHLASYADATEDWSGVLPLLARCFSLPGGVSARVHLEKNTETLVGNIVHTLTEEATNEKGTPQEAVASLSRLAKWINQVQEIGYVSAPACADFQERLAVAAHSVAVGQFKKGDLSGSSETLKVALAFATDPESRRLIGEELATLAKRRKKKTSDAVVAWVFSGLVGFGVLASIMDATNGKPSSGKGGQSPVVSAQGAGTSKGNRRAQMTRLESEIEQGRLLISRSEQELGRLDSSLGVSKAQIERYNATIERMEAEAEAGAEVDRSRYEGLVATQNEAVEAHNQTLARRRAAYAEYERVLRETNAKVEAYNRLVR